jgi:hypothetical protein
MATPVPNLYERDIPWTEEDFLALPPPSDNRRIELLDGALLVSSYARGGHQRLSYRTQVALDVAAPDGLEVLATVNVRVGPGKILVPDLVVLNDPGLDLVVYDASMVEMIVEISGRGHPAMDRAIKPALYAQAGIPHYLRIELRDGDPIGFGYRLTRGRYVEVARSEPGKPLVLTEPLAVTLDLATLAATTRPPR